MFFIKNIIIPGAANKPISLDICYKETNKPKPIVIYAHGFNGFKDWGNFDLIAHQFAAENFVLVKFNFSHNGTSPASPEIFTEQEAFGNNNYTKQLEDLQRVTDWVCDLQNQYHAELDIHQLFLIGHSMGGGMALLHAAGDKRIKKIITWAAISECKTPWGTWPAAKMKEWKESGVQYYINSRTGQHMPMYYQLYEDYINNKEKLDIANAIKKITIPILLCHGNADTAVPVDKAYLLQSWQPNATLFIVASDHVFGRSHPWEHDYLPAAMKEVVEKSIALLQG